ncbi:MAG TPA: hypothetical protein VE153_34385 [Myxococcus sp.]|nr:hypothetical protein [Myxococcus sp.]
MKKLLWGAAMAVLFVGCGAGEEQELVVEYPPVGSISSELTPRLPTPQLCLGFCPSSPDNEPLGQLCTLSSQQCLNGILTCYYKCVEIEPRPY